MCQLSSMGKVYCAYTLAAQQTPTPVPIIHFCRICTSRAEPKGRRGPSGCHPSRRLTPPLWVVFAAPWCADGTCDAARCWLHSAYDGTALQRSVAPGATAATTASYSLPKCTSDTWWSSVWWRERGCDGGSSSSAQPRTCHRAMQAWHERAAAACLPPLAAPLLLS